MFEFLFNYSRTVFSKGSFVLLGAWPVWALVACILLGAAALAVPVWRMRDRASGRARGVRLGLLWLMQSMLLAIVLLMLWQPAMSVATLKPQQNIVAVVVDDSRSMALNEDGKTRKEKALEALNNKGLLEKLGKKFQVRMYRFSSGAERMEKLDQWKVEGNATHIGESLAQVAAESSTLPIGAVVLFSDGADNAGGVDLETINLLKRQRIPVHTVGVGRERFDKDVEVTDVQTAARALADSRVSAVVTVKQRGYRSAKGRITIKTDNATLASQEMTFQADGTLQTETVVFNAGNAGLRNLHVSVEPLQGKKTRATIP